MRDYLLCSSLSNTTTTSTTTSPVAHLCWSVAGVVAAADVVGDRHGHAQPQTQAHSDPQQQQQQQQKQ